MTGYNDRLFGGGVRGWLHNGRFRWLANVASGANTSSVFELGCFDAKSVKYLPIRPHRYVGADANWEGGLDHAREQWPEYEFINCDYPEKLDAIKVPFKCSICMETFEHIPVDRVDGYIDQLARLTESYLFVTVPVEKGPIFLGKYVAKHMIRSLAENDAEIGSFTIADVFNASIGRCDKVQRREHKGFDYAWLADRIKRKFRIHRYDGYPFGWLPRVANFGVGIVAESR